MPKVEKKKAALAVVGLALVALVIGLSVGLTQKNRNNKSASSLASASGGIAADSAIVDGVCPPGTAAKGAKTGKSGDMSMMAKSGKSGAKMEKSEAKAGKEAGDYYYLGPEAKSAKDAKGGKSGDMSMMAAKDAKSGKCVPLMSMCDMMAKGAKMEKSGKSGDMSLMAKAKSGKSGDMSLMAKAKSGKSGGGEAGDYYYEPFYYEPGSDASRSGSAKSGVKSGKSGAVMSMMGEGCTCSKGAKTGKSGDMSLMAKGGKSGVDGAKSGKSGDMSLMAKGGKSGAKAEKEGCTCAQPSACGGPPPPTPGTCVCDETPFVFTCSGSGTTCTCDRAGCAARVPLGTPTFSDAATCCSNIGEVECSEANVVCNPPDAAPPGPTPPDADFTPFPTAGSTPTVSAEATAPPTMPGRSP